MIFFQGTIVRKAHRTQFTYAMLTLLLTSTCSGIQLSGIQAPRPVPEGACVVVGFLGGRDAWNDSEKGVRKTALLIRDSRLPVYAETFENRRRDVAEEFVVQALDRNADGFIDSYESGRATLIVYGQSFGGAATIKFAEQLEKRSVRVHMTLQIDSVGRGDDKVPPNVRYAANLYQDNGWLIAGEHPISASDASRTHILGNWRFDYSQTPGSEIDISHLPWWKVIFRGAHAKMDRDDRVWEVVTELVRAGCRGDDLEQVLPNLPLPRQPDEPPIPAGSMSEIQ